ncbi:MAG: hypothetical protein IT424_05930 [Pirellulales bacterium]|nr:hypothetical protein [Pirellulales bacterium]
MNYSAALNALRDRGQLIGATIRYNLARGLPLLTEAEPCFRQLREWLHGRGETFGVGEQLRCWERESTYGPGELGAELSRRGRDQLAAALDALAAGQQPLPLAILNASDAVDAPLRWLSLQVIPAGESLSLIVAISEADVADDLPGDIVTAGLLLYALAAVTGRAVGELIVNVGLLTLDGSAPAESRDVRPLTIVPPCGGLEGLLSLEWRHVRSEAVA